MKKVLALVLTFALAVSLTPAALAAVGRAEHYAPPGTAGGSDACLNAGEAADFAPSVIAEQGGNFLEVSTSINGSAATVELSGGAQSAPSPEPISINASSLGSGVASLAVGQKLADRAADSGGLAVTMPNGNKLELAGETVQALSQQSAGEPLTLYLAAGAADGGINSVLRGVPAAAVFELKISKGGEELHDFAGGVTATVSTGAASGGSADLELLHLTDGYGLPEQVTFWSATASSVTWTASSASPFVLVKKGSVKTVPPFTDVAKDGWEYAGVRYCWYYGMANGTSADTFSPDSELTRVQLWTILARLDGQPLTGDVMLQARAWAVSAGITDGTDPGSAITREQLAATLCRYAKYKNYDVSVGEDTNILSYDDAFGISEYAVPAIQWACGAGVMSGSGNMLMPQGTASRAQAAAMLMRFCLNTVK